MSALLGRGYIVDLLVRDGESLVLTAHQCLRLSPAGTAAILYLDRPRSEAHLEAHLRGKFGDPPDGAFARLVGDLVSCEVLEFVTDHG